MQGYLLILLKNKEKNKSGNINIFHKNIYKPKLLFISNFKTIWSINWSL